MTDRGGSEQQGPTSRRVFVSYSHDSDEHRARVLGLGERLRKDGFDAWVDRYVEGSPVEKWPRWMLDQLDAAAFVLVVCTETYYRRFRGHEVSGGGKGVDWEGALITQELYDARSASVKFVPVLFEAAATRFIPEPLRGATHYTLDSEAGYAPLRDFLGGAAGVEAGPIGPLAVRPRGRGTPSNFDKAPPDAELSRLSEEKKRRVVAGEDTREIDDQIVARRRQLRDHDLLGPGTRFYNGRFEVIEPIGRRGFGAVWKAYDAQLGQRVAVKVLHPQFRRRAPFGEARNASAARADGACRARRLAADTDRELRERRSQGGVHVVRGARGPRRGAVPAQHGLQLDDVSPDAA